MIKKVCKIIIIAIVILVIIVGIMYWIDYYRMKDGKKPYFSTWGVQLNHQNENHVETDINNAENYQKYVKTIDNITIKLDIPNDWNYEEIPKNEENNFYKYALKLYKNDENQYAILDLSNDKFGVCGTGRTTKNITLNNGKEATVGYYDGDKNWSDISFYSINEYIAIINCGLVDTDADEVIDFIKTIDIY